MASSANVPWRMETLPSARHRRDGRGGLVADKKRQGPHRREWILFQNQVNRDRMGAAVFTTGPYMEMAISAMTPMTPAVEDGVLTWRVPLGNGAVPHVALEDCGYYARWLFDNPDRANGT